MSDVSIWKRMGGWFRRSQQPPAGDDVIRHDAEGMAFEAEFDKSEDNSRISLSPRKNKNQLATMEEGFNRLVGALESLNNNVMEQCRQNEQLQEKLMRLPDLIDRLPDAVDKQVEITREIRQELQNQSVQSDRLSATLHSLPELNQAQTDRLGEICQHLENSAETESKMAASLQQSDASMRAMADNSQKLNVTLFSLNDVLKQNEERLANLLQKQNRRFGLLLLLTALLIAVIISAIFIFWRSGSST